MRLVHSWAEGKIPTHVCGEGGCGEKQGEMKWWENDRKKRGNREKLGGRKRWEDKMRERDKAQRDGEGGGGEEGG